MPPLSVFGTDVSIRANFYSLNDLHIAAGSQAKHQPSRFLRNEQTQALIAEIEKYPNLGILDSEKGTNSYLLDKSANSQTLAVEIIKGRNGGTFVCKELVYAYAMWISPKFSLAVIRAFDHLASGGKVMAAPASQPAPKQHPSYDPNEFYLVHKSSLDSGACICTPNTWGQLTTSPIPPETIVMLKAARSFIDGVKQEGYMLIKPEDLLKKLAL